MDTKTATAKRVSDVRIAKGVSLEQFAEDSGIPYTSLHRKLSARSSFTVEQIADAAKALGVRPASLVVFTEPEDAA